MDEDLRLMMGAIKRLEEQNRELRETVNHVADMCADMLTIVQGIIDLCVTQDGESEPIDEQVTTNG